LTRQAAFIHSKKLDEYSYPPECPLNTSRAGRTRKVLNSMGLLSGPGRKLVAPTKADRLTLKKFHTARYLHALKTAAKGHWDTEALSMGLGTPDCPIFKDMYDYPAFAAGATLNGAELILSNEAQLVFNPSGGYHHAAPEHAAGFCYINDVALACLTLTEQKKRVLYLDIDVHHADEVQNAFYDRNDVMTISLHENPRTLFPGTGYAEEIGKRAGKGYSVNIPLPVGIYDSAYMDIFKPLVPPLIDAYDPDVIMFELGADTLSGDPLAHLSLTNNVYADVLNILLSYDKPILMTGGGGYNVENTVRAWALAWTVLCGTDTQHDISLGLGGVMLESTDWQGGLRDRVIPVVAEQRKMVEPLVGATIETIKKLIFSYHGL